MANVPLRLTRTLIGTVNPVLLGFLATGPRQHFGSPLVQALARRLRRDEGSSMHLRRHSQQHLSRGGALRRIKAAQEETVFAL